MPYGEKLKTIKKEKHLTNAEIAKICDVSLPTVTRLFDEKNLSGNFETFVSLARGLGISLDELAGLKQPNESTVTSPMVETINSYTEVIKEKDERISELKEQNTKLEKEKNEVRREKHRITSALIMLIAILVVGLLIDLCNGHIGHFRY